MAACPHGKRPVSKEEEREKGRKGFLDSRMHHLLVVFSAGDSGAFGRGWLISPLSRCFFSHARSERFSWRGRVGLK